MCVCVCVCVDSKTISMHCISLGLLATSLPAPLTPTLTMPPAALSIRITRCDPLFLAAAATAAAATAAVAVDPRNRSIHLLFCFSRFAVALFWSTRLFEKKTWHEARLIGDRQKKGVNDRNNTPQLELEIVQSSIRHRSSIQLMRDHCH